MFSLLQLYVLKYLAPSCLLSQLFCSLNYLLFMLSVKELPFSQFLFLLSKKTIQLFPSCSFSGLFLFILLILNKSKYYTLFPENFINLILLFSNLAGNFWVNINGSGWSNIGHNIGRITELTVHVVWRRWLEGVGIDFSLIPLILLSISVLSVDNRLLGLCVFAFGEEFVHKICLVIDLILCVIWYL